MFASTTRHRHASDSLPLVHRMYLCKVVEHSACAPSKSVAAAGRRCRALNHSATAKMRILTLMLIAMQQLCCRFKNQNGHSLAPGPRTLLECMLVTPSRISDMVREIKSQHGSDEAICTMAAFASADHVLSSVFSGTGAFESAANWALASLADSLGVRCGRVIFLSHY